MAIIELEMPKMGESIMEATILKWLKKPGDIVVLDEPVLEIATDKVDSEVPSTTAGTITEILYNENDIVPIGTVIARISTDANTSTSPSSKPEVPAASPEPIAATSSVPAQNTDTSSNTSSQSTSNVNNAVVSNAVGGDRFYSPLVLSIARSEGIGMAELENIPGTGNNGRVSKKDILQYVKNRGQQSPNNETPIVSETASNAETNSSSIATTSVGATTTTPNLTSSSTSTTTSPTGNVEIIAMDRMRKLIANHMVNSKQTSPHVTSFMEADVTHIVNWRNKVKLQFEKMYGEKITFTPIFIEAITKSIIKYPMINASVDGDNIIVKKDINIGMATALPSGNLIVPVIKNADYKNLVGLTKEVNQLASAARNGKLKPEDTQGGTFTMTNVGTFGSLMGTPIINQPQVAILAVGAIKKRPMVLETAEGDVIAIRHMMYLSLSYDHRIVDGSLGASFLTEVAKELEAFDPNRAI